MGRKTKRKLIKQKRQKYKKHCHRNVMKKCLHNCTLMSEQIFRENGDRTSLTGKGTLKIFNKLVE